MCILVCLCNTLGSDSFYDWIARNRGLLHCLHRVWNWTNDSLWSPHTASCILSPMSLFVYPGGLDGRETYLSHGNHRRYRQLKLNWIIIMIIHEVRPFISALQDWQDMPTTQVPMNTHLVDRDPRCRISLQFARLEPKLSHWRRPGCRTLPPTVRRSGWYFLWTGLPCLVAKTGWQIGLGCSRTQDPRNRRHCVDFERNQGHWICTRSLHHRSLLSAMKWTSNLHFCWWSTQRFYILRKRYQLYLTDILFCWLSEFVLNHKLGLDIL